MEIKKIVFDEIKARSKVEILNEDTNIKYLGIDSINIIKLIVAIEEKLSLETDFDDLVISETTTVSDIIEYYNKLKK